MPTLIVHFPSGDAGCIIDRRLLIGRRLCNDVVINDLRISRIHAAIEQEQGAWLLSDNHSRAGTYVNGQRLVDRRALKDGDRIQMGTMRLTFHSENRLPDGVAALRLPSPGAEGITFSCVCGNILWVSIRDTGLRGVCRRCRRSVVAPLADVRGTAAAVSADAAGACGICQCKILSGEPTTACPSCGLVFHEECWIENRGCSAYGCPQVNSLAPEESPVEEAPVGMDETLLEETRPPWDRMLLAGSIVAAVLGTVTFGVTALGMGILGLVQMRRARHRRGWMLAGVVVSALALPLGILASRALWLDAPFAFWVSR